MRYVLGVIGMVVLAVAAIILIVSRDPADISQPEGEKQLNLVDFTDSPATASFTIEGEVNGVNEHNSIKISVSQARRTIEHRRGYNGQILSSQTFSNTHDGFDHFLHALKNAGFSNEQEPEYESHKGVCPFGNRYIYELNEGSDRIMRLWSTTCDDDDGNFAGEENQIKRLFQLQIPDYKEFAEDVRL